MSVKINTWKGWAPAASRYILPPGGAVEQVNLTTFVPGQLSARGGSKKTVTTSKRMIELWGLSTGSGQTDIILGQSDSGDIVEFSGGEEKILSTGVFTGDHPVTFSQGRRGEVYIYQGYGARGLIRDSEGVTRPVGLEEPTAPPGIAVDLSPSYSVLRIDIVDAGSGYSSAPSVKIGAPPTGGKQATALALLDGKSVGQINVIDGGDGYTKPPIVVIDPPVFQDEDGAGAVAELEDGAPGGDHRTGVLFWDLYQPSNFGFWCACDINGDPLPRWRNGFLLKAYGGSGQGAFMYLELTELGKYFAGLGGTVTQNPPPNPGGLPGFPTNCNTNGEDASAYEGLGPNDFFKSWQVFDWGSGYKPGDEVYAYIFTVASFSTSTFICGTLPNNQACPVVFKGYVRGSDDCPDDLTVIADNRYRRAKLKTKPKDGGSGYLLPPNFITDSGEIIKSSINDNGEVTSLNPDNPSTLYSWAPEVEDDAEALKAEALSVIRPSFRGKYQCYYRYTNGKAEQGKQTLVFSNLSPVTEVDCGEQAKKLTWTVPAAGPENATHIELWRSTAGQAMTLFRVAILPIGSTTFQDFLSDTSLTDTKRADYAYDTILLSDGRLKMNSRGVASTDFAVGTVFQDRAFLAVDTTGKRPNTLLYSEPDRPEAIPEINEIPLQQNVRDSDYITALIPFAGALMVMQAKHCYRLNFVSRPEIDTTVALVAYRGCLNQRCWDIWMGSCYVLDDHGFYKMDPQGSVEDVSDAIATLFCTSDDLQDQTLDFSKREFWFVRADKNLGVIRIHVSFVGDEGKFPTRQIVYDPDSKAFWVESYPYVFSAGSEVRTKDGFVQPIVSSESGIHILSHGLTDDGTPVEYAFRSGNFAYETDETSKNGAQQGGRTVSVVYRPTDASCLLKLATYYNDSASPRGNVVRRDRGVGFIHDDIEPAAIVDMIKMPHQEAESHGVARALFAGKTISDFSGSDSHISIRLYGKQNEAGPISIHDVTLAGVVSSVG
jgi:hypothetical protein